MLPTLSNTDTDYWGVWLGGGAYMAVMASFWKVTKAMPRGLVWTFSFSFLYSSFSFASILV